MEDLKKQLSGEFDARLEELGATELTSDAYRNATDGMTKIADRIIEIEKIEAEQALKEKQAKTDKLDKVCRVGVEVLKTAVMVGVGIWAFKASIKFEEEGTFTTTGGRNIVNQLTKWIKP